MEDKQGQLEQMNEIFNYMKQKNVSKTREKFFIKLHKIFPSSKNNN